MKQEKYILMLVVFLVLYLYLVNYHQREAFGFMKRRALGFDGLTARSSEPHIADTKYTREAVKVINQVLKEIEKQTKIKYEYLGQDQLQIIPMGDKVRYNADVFVVDRNIHKNTDVVKRFIIIFDVDCHKNVNVLTINASNAFKYPQKDFMDYPSPNLILSDENLGFDYTIMGVNKSSIPFSLFKGPVSDEGLTSTMYQETIHPSAIQEKQLENRLGTKCQNIPFNPSIHMSLTDKNEYTWMFDKARGITSFPHGSSVN